MRPYFLPSRQRAGWKALTGRTKASRRLFRLTAVLTAAMVIATAGAGAQSASVKARKRVWQCSSAVLRAR